MNALLTEMDGFNKAQSRRYSHEKYPNVNIIIIAATNRMSVIDPALLRPGRFDRHVRVKPPDAEGRNKILKIHVKDVMMGQDVNLAILASDELTANFTGAELRNVVNEAALLAIRSNKQVVCQDNLLSAINRIKQMKDLSKSEYR